MGKIEIINIIKNVICEIYKKDKDLFENNVNERTITWNFACYLKKYKKFAWYNIDCEYNRNGEWVKACWEYYQTYPDIIVHKRGKNNNIKDWWIIIYWWLKQKNDLPKRIKKKIWKK